MSKNVRRRRVVESGADRQVDHRGDFEHCPSCSNPMEDKQWDAAAVTLVLSPACYKAGYASVISECPNCFELSWVHASMRAFGWNDAWPEDWKKAVEAREASIKLQALRDWGSSICHHCKKLESGKIEYHAWRSCVKGSGGAEKECEQYVPVK